MKLDNLVGKDFRYISKYDGKESNWIGVVDRITITTVIKDYKLGEYVPEIHIISKNGQSYLLHELIFLK